MTSRTPSIRFEGYTDIWELRRLSELYSRGGSGGTPRSTNKAYYNGKIPFLGISDISNSNGFIDKTEKYITEEGLNNSSAWIVPAGSISLAMYASVGKLAILNTDVATSQAFYNMVFDDDNLRDYVYQRLSKANESGEWTKLISTGTQANLNADKVKNFEISIPTNKREMSMISHFFMDLDNLITLHQQKLIKLQTVKKSMLENMFPKEGYNVPEIRFKGFADIWEQRKVGEYCEMFNGDRSSKYPNDNDMVDDGIPFINAGDLENGAVNLCSANKITREKYNQLGGAKLRLGDILYCLRGTLGKNAFIDNFDEGTVASSLVAIRPKNIDGRYLYYILNSDIELSQRLVHDEGAAQPNLSAKSVSEFDMPVPTKAEQQKISTYFTTLDNLITLQQQKLTKLQTVKKSMLENMFV